MVDNWVGQGPYIWSEACKMTLDGAIQKIIALCIRIGSVCACSTCAYTDTRCVHCEEYVCS